MFAQGVSALYQGKRNMDITSFTAVLRKLEDTDKSSNFILLLLTLLFLLSLLFFCGKMLLINPANCERRKKVIIFSFLSRNCYKFNFLQSSANLVS